MSEEKTQAADEVRKRLDELNAAIKVAFDAGLSVDIQSSELVERKTVGETIYPQVAVELKTVIVYL